MDYIVYTDGASEPTNPGPTAWGYVILQDDHETIVHSDTGMWQHSTNQRAELAGIVEALEWLARSYPSPQGVQV